MKHKHMMTGGVLGGVAAVATAAIATTALYLKNRSTIPEGAVAVAPFNAKKYMGKWYEIARMDYSHEHNLDNASAEYSMNKDGSIKVVNTGYNFKKSKQERAVGKACFVQSPQIAMLKVSFFGPIYSGYNVIAIDKDYKYALVVGRNLDYMWILSREPRIPENVKNEYLEKAKSLGYKIDKLVWSDHK